MSTKLKARRAAVLLKTDNSDEELTILSPKCSVTNELDWSYTARCTKEWSGDELLSHLCSKVFTIPPRDYNPSAPFVYIKTEDGVTITLPHGYRIPLMFIAKYQWETTIRTLSLPNRHRWEAVRDELFHLSRLCHALFSKARAKAENVGMEKGWRCVMFDRVLTRFYKGWPVNSPAKLEAFISHFSSKEYEGDVLKYDWKRWALKGFFRPSSQTIYLTEENINDGIRAADLKTRLSKIDNVWTLKTNNSLKLRPIKFMQPTDGSSSDLSDLTELSVDCDGDDEISTRNTNLKLHSLFMVETPTKRSREASEGDETKNRSGKRAKLEEIVRSISSLPCTPIPSSNGPRPGDLLDENHNSLPKFKAPRRILHSSGWKPLSVMDGLASQSQREEQAEAGSGILPACNSSTSIRTSLNLTSSTKLVLRPPIPSDDPMEDSLPSNANTSNSSSNKIALLSPPLHTDASPTSPNLPLNSSISKGKQPESASKNPTTTATSTATGDPFRNLRNSAYVSLPISSRLPRSRLRRPTAPAPGTSPMPSPDITPRKGTGRRVVKPTYVDSLTDGDEVPEVPSSFPVAVKKRRPIPIPKKRCVTKSGADGDTNMNGKQEEANIAKTQQKESIEEGGIQRSAPSSTKTTTNLMNMEGNNNDGEEVVQLVLEGLGVIPGCALSLSSLSSLSSSPTPSGSTPLVPNTGVVDVTADADGEYGSQQLKDRIRELKTRFMGFRDNLEKIIGRLEVLEGGEGEDAVGGGCLGQESADGGNLVPHASQTEDRRKRKDKESDLDIEMIGASAGAIPGYVDAAVGVDADASVVLRDVSVQADGPDLTVVASTTGAVQTFDVSSGVTRKIKPTLSLESKTDEVFPSPMHSMDNTTLSTMVDNLVSIKMLSMMQTLVKSSNSKVAESSSTGTNTTTDPIATEPDSGIRDQTISLSSLSFSAASHSMNAYDSIMSNLLGELKTIKEEARCREQSEKDDLLAMRQLHSAEVDALRRRLSYLESRNPSLGRWDTNNASGRWKSSRVEDSLELDRYHPEDNGGTNHPFRQEHQQYGDRSNQPFQQNGLCRHSSGSTCTTNPEGEPTRKSTPSTPLSKKPNLLRPPSLSVLTSTADSTSQSSSLLTPTPLTASERHYSFGFSKNNMDDSIPLPLPLPVKSQRKHHMMALARAHFS